jgi:hypothetical protein
MGRRADFKLLTESEAALEGCGRGAVAVALRGSALCAERLRVTGVSRRKVECSVGSLRRAPRRSAAHRLQDHGAEHEQAAGGAGGDAEGDFASRELPDVGDGEERRVEKGDRYRRRDGELLQLPQHRRLAPGSAQNFALRRLCPRADTDAI